MLEIILLDVLFLVVVCIFLAMALIPFYKNLNDKINRKFEEKESSK